MIIELEKFDSDTHYDPMHHQIQAINQEQWTQSNRKPLIHIGLHNTEWGKILIGTIEDQLAWLSFSEDTSIIKERFPGAGVIQCEDSTENFADAVIGLLHLPTAHINLPLFLLGTDLQLSVWQALLKIPCGSTKTYSDIAESVNHPQAVRAVGTAIGKNPISLVIPCHRVLPKSGGIGNYAWGSEIKERLLKTEGVSI